MKKQLLILVLAIFALGFSTSTFGQAPNLTGAPSCPPVLPLVCTDDNGLEPIVGQTYNYTVTIGNPPSGTNSFHWFVTTDQGFITPTGITAARELGDGSGPHILLGGAGYNDPANGAATISMSWKYWTHNPANPVFLVIYVENEVTGGCTTDNIQVYIIIPSHSFSLDIANIDANGAAQGDLYATCVAPVQSATYDVGSGTVLMNYGTNYMFFAVTAGNFFHSWLPSFQTGGAGLANSREVTAVHWAYTDEAVTGTWTAMAETAPGSNLWTTSTPVEAPSNGTVGAEGLCIVVRITITNNQTPTLLANDPITLAVDGVMYDASADPGDEYLTAALGDLDDATCALDGFTNDIATQVLSPRPDITGNPAGFVPKDDN